MNEVSLFRLYVLRAMYLFIVVGLGIYLWPGVLDPEVLERRQLLGGEDPQDELVPTSLAQRGELKPDDHLPEHLPKHSDVKSERDHKPNGKKT